MRLSDRLSGYFPEPVRSRGKNYYLNKNVLVLDASDHDFETVVTGTEEYEVLLEFAGGDLCAYCDCPFFEGGSGFCEHIWATVLEAEKRGALPAVSNAAEFDFIAGIAEEDFIDKLEDKPYFSGSAVIKQTPEPKWKLALAQITRSVNQTGADSISLFPEKVMQIIYVVDIERSIYEQGVFVMIMVREPKKDKTWGKPKLKRLEKSEVASLPEKEDREILSLIEGVAGLEGSRSYSYYSHCIENHFIVPATLHEKLMPLLCKTGRLWTQNSPDDEPFELGWDDGKPWQLRLIVEPHTQKEGLYTLTGRFYREKESLAMDKPSLLIAGGLLFLENKVALLNDYSAFGWIAILRKSKNLEIPSDQISDFQEQIYSMPVSPPLVLPDQLQIETISPVPEKRLRLKTKKGGYRKRPPLVGEIHFDYDGFLVPAGEKKMRFLDSEKKQVLTRNQAEEKKAFQELQETEFRLSAASRYIRKENGHFELAPSKLTRVVPVLIGNGWHVEAEGKVYRQAGSFKMRVSSGIEWFELSGDMDFDGYSSSITELLRSLRKGKSIVELGDGSFGVLPEEWLKKYGILARLGEVNDDRIHFKKSQILFLDALLAEKESVETDSVFDNLRTSIRTFDGVVPFEPSKGFHGSLRQYQKDGVGWLRFLKEFGFGGCLADDMGLGKTVQVLALLHYLKEEASGKNTVSSLVVVPRSLLFNWREETEKFTPSLKVLVHSGSDRQKPGSHFNDYDIILVTYGTMLRDILELKKHLFEYVILDEAQAIKNSASQSAKAVRLLQANHRLALSGTPIENHIGELWSLFEFLNPGILGKVSVFKGVTSKVDEESRVALTKALRPFILRRTKGEVAKDLPEKNEQTIYCEMKPEQKNFYNELKKYYQANILASIKNKGMGKSKMRILEALLRLRQAACHPGLVDPKRLDGQSTKLEALYESLKEVMDEGHKILVFSQFTSLLAIVKRRLESEGIRYVYLDGHTKDRKEKVDLFQNDNSFPLFLISLKAGGVGLNLTAAGYVFLLDPWWNPAVEAQAIDRTHRIGQTKNVFAYRLICKDTVEEKVLELQKKKRELAESIIGGDTSLMKNLSHEDLEFLLT